MSRPIVDSPPRAKAPEQHPRAGCEVTAARPGGLIPVRTAIGGHPRYRLPAGDEDQRPSLG